MLKESKESSVDAVGGEAAGLPVLPGLQVENYGNVSLPIDETVGEKLIKISSQAPYGHKYQTITNTEGNNNIII